MSPSTKIHLHFNYKDKRKGVRKWLKEQGETASNIEIIVAYYAFHCGVTLVPYIYISENFGNFVTWYNNLRDLSQLKTTT